MRYLLYILLICLPYALAAQKADMIILQAKAAAEKNDYGTAVELLASINPNNLTAMKFKADCFYGINNYDEALQAYFTINKLFKDEAMFEIAKCYAAKGNVDEALSWLEKYLNLKNKLDEYAIVSDKAFQSLTNTKQWKNIWKKDWYSQSEIQQNAVYSLLRIGNGQAALDELDKEQSRSIPRHVYFACRAKTYTQLKQWEAALSNINEALELQKSIDDYWIVRGNIYFEVAEYAKAEEDYSKAMKLNPYIIPLYLKRSEAARLAGDFSQAAEDMDIYQQLYPKTPETIYQLGKLEAARENFSEAIAYFNKLLSKNKSNPEYYMERGLIELKIEDYQAADEDFGMALDLNPSLREAYLNKGKIRIYLLDNDSACFNFEKASSLGSVEASKLYVEHCSKQK
ncbi:MAG TPA: tetratricopeptide repeat protein [Bacteroidales bacterium]|nr:tetratricopeptide repeat protein [Bacteroidales bacterium]